jgi:hypothetical protein
MADYVEIAEISQAIEREDERWLYAAEENLTQYMQTTSSTTYMNRAISEFIACGLYKVAIRLLERFIKLHGWKRFLMFCNFQFSYRGIPESSFITDPFFQYFAQQWATALNENNVLAIYAAPREKCPKYGWMAYHLAPLCFQVPKTYGRSMHVYMKKYRKMIAAGKASSLAPSNKKRKFSSDSNSEPESVEPEVVEPPEVLEPEVLEPEVLEPEVVKEQEKVALKKIPSYVNIEDPWSLEASEVEVSEVEASEVSEVEASEVEASKVEASKVEASATRAEALVNETNQKVGWFTSWFKNAW